MPPLYIPRAIGGYANTLSPDEATAGGYRLPETGKRIAKLIAAQRKTVNSPGSPFKLRHHVKLDDDIDSPKVDLKFSFLKKGETKDGKPLSAARIERRLSPKELDDGTPWNEPGYYLATMKAQKQGTGGMMGKFLSSEADVVKGDPGFGVVSTIDASYKPYVGYTGKHFKKDYPGATEVSKDVYEWSHPKKLTGAIGAGLGPALYSPDAAVAHNVPKPEDEALEEAANPLEYIAGPGGIISKGLSYLGDVAIGAAPKIYKNVRSYFGR